MYHSSLLFNVAINTFMQVRLPCALNHQLIDIKRWVCNLLFLEEDDFCNLENLACACRTTPHAIYGYTLLIP